MAALDASIEWEGFLAGADPVWTRLPRDWWEAPYLGNGMMGTLVRQTGDRTVEWQVGRSDVEDHRQMNYGMGRLPIGRFLLHTRGDLEGCALRLDLLRAEAAGAIRTTEGSISIQTLVHADQMAIAVRWKGEGGESDATLEWEPAEALHPRLAVKPDPERKKTWTPNPPGYLNEVDGAPVWVQPLSEGAYATAWVVSREDGWNTLFASTQYAWPGSPDEVAEAAARAAGAAAGTPWPTFLDAHRAAWRSYYAQSYLSIPDPYWQSFYWNQIYKLRAATRSDGVVLGIQGPWDQPTPWPGIWWNLNVQLTYWPMYTANHLELARPLPDSLRTYLPNLIASVRPEYRHDSAAIYRSSTARLSGGVFYPSLVEPPGTPGDHEMGNLLWACHNVWLHYRMSLDEALLRESLYPVLRRAVNYYLHFLQEGPDGVLHLPPTRSPEYKSGPDCNYDLALLRWGANALLSAVERLDIDEPLAPAWRRVLDRLAPFPEGENGFLIADGVPMDSSHRHYSHLLMIYPLYQVNVEQPDGETRIRRSLDHWHSFPDALFGYSFTGGASISAAIGDGDRALDYLNAFKGFIEPNTMYREAGPVIETPLSAAQSIHDMLLQSWDAADGPLIRIFPAPPDAWRDIIFHQWRAEGAFLVSAARQDGNLAWVRISSLAGEPCRIRAEFSGPPRVVGGDPAHVAETGAGRYSLGLRAGESIVLADPAWRGTPAIAPVSGSMPDTPIFGLHAP
ncbi:MAG: alpha-L-fucosidase [Candidatus Hydrogenedentes bacterium]|nr:alpha-L-fucosidase [Candidatus Hydrogenedentota bacterium]